MSPFALTLLLAAAAPSCSYDVVAGPEARELRVEAGFEGPASDALEVDEGLEGFVDGLEQSRGGSWASRSLEAPAPGVRASDPLRIRYRFRLGAAARSSGDAQGAFEHEGALLAPPSVWLARPVGASGRCRLHVTTPPGVEFVTGLPAVPGGGAYELDLGAMREAPYSGFGPFRRLGADVGGARLDLALAPGALGVGDDALRSWLAASGRAVAAYFGRFPVPRVQVLVIPGGRRAIGYGTTLAGGGASILVWVGAKARQQDLDDDWVLVHEMTHLAFPTLPRRQHWLEEGLATYVEPIARVGVGTMSRDAAWKSMLEGLPRGLPRGRDGGLDGASSIDRLYWGGALYWFLADLEIRERTGNRQGLPDALRGILAAGGNAMAEWEARDALAKGDAAVGLTVLTGLFDRMADQTRRVDLAAIFDRLGVSLRGGQVVYDETRPLAAVRRSLIAPPAAPRVTPRP